VKEPFGEPDQEHADPVDRSFEEDRLYQRGAVEVRAFGGGPYRRR
jgi:hypothetical protein